MSSVTIAKSRWARIAGRVKCEIEKLVGNDVPVSLEAIATSLGVSAIEPRTLSVDGYIGRESDGRLVIRYRADACATRRRFTIAHEIGHLLLDRVGGIPLKSQVSRGARQDEEEVLADRIAAEVLMPESAFKQDLLSTAPSFRAMQVLAGKYAVSMRAVRRRVHEFPAVPSLEFHVRRQVRSASNALLTFTNGRRVLFSSPLPMIVDRLQQVGEGERCELELDLDSERTQIAIVRLPQQVVGATSSFVFVGWIPSATVPKGGESTAAFGFTDAQKHSRSEMQSGRHNDLRMNFE